MGVKEAMGAAGAVVQRIDQGEGPDLDWDGCLAATAHLADRCSKTELLEALTYLGAQLVGARKTQDADAVLAMHQISRAVAEYQSRQGKAA